MTTRNFDDFDEFAEDYRTTHTKNVGWSGADSFYFAEMKVKLLQQSEKNTEQQLLDVGCGDGVTEMFIAEYFSNWISTGIDVSKESIEVAQRKNISNTLFKKYDGLNIPFADDSFDIIFIAGVLHHVAFEFHQQLIEEMYRVLRPGGRLYLFEHNPYNPVTKHLVNTCVFDKDARLLKPGYASRIFEKNKFSITSKKFIIFFPRKGLLSKLIFLEKYLVNVPLGGQYFISFKK